MEILGKTPINPWLFVSGKSFGYLTWIFLMLDLFGVIPNHTDLLLRQVALSLLASGILVILLSSFSLGRAVRIGLPDSKTELKRSGIYKISRNPMYIGLGLVTLSSMLYTLNIFIAIAGIYSILVYHFIILGEERFLAKRFGEEYRTYKKQVPRYL